MEYVSFQCIDSTQPTHVITDPQGEKCAGCGAGLKAGPNECCYCGRPAVGQPEDGWRKID